MLEPWNDSSILPPPVHTTPCEKNIDVKELVHTCNVVKKVLSKQSPLHRESAILSRFLYKYDKKFRNDIGYRNFKKVNTALRKYLMLNLLRDIENFLSALPSGNDDLYLPTRQMLEYVLVRLLTFSKLMVRIYVCSKQAAVLYLDRVKRGESHWMSVMPFALLSRVWSISMVLLQHSCSWYTNLYPFLDKLGLKGLAFLPTDYTLPLDIEEWLDIENLDSFGRFNWSQKKQVPIDPSLLENEEGDTLDTILDYVSQINDNTEEEEMEYKYLPVNNDPLQVISIKNVDEGEVISRASFNLSKTLAASAPNKFFHSAERVTNKDCLQKFIDTEESLRQESSKNSLTSHLSFMQWQALKNSLLKLLESLSNNRKIERKFQKIWKEKSLDYINE